MQVSEASQELVGFRFMNDAPRDGTFIRLRSDRTEGEEIGQWQNHAEMKSGGAWFTRDGCYISPWPTYWAPQPPRHKEGHTSPTEPDAAG